MAPEEISKRQMIAALRQFRDRFELPFTDDQLGDVPFYSPADDSPEMKYLRDRRAGARRLPAVPQQRVHAVASRRTGRASSGSTGARSRARGSRPRSPGSTLMSQLMKDPNVGKLIVPIVPGRGADVRHAADVQGVRHLLRRRADCTTRSIRGR